jgi:type IV secretion system protein VirB2
MTTRGSRDWGVAAGDFAEGFRLALRWGVPLLLIATLVMPPLAHAQAVTGGTNPTTILNNIATFILGPFGQALAVLSVIGIGAAFIFGRVTLGLLGGLVGGLVLIFGASYLVTQFVGNGGGG